MASPQLENGYTKIANEIIEHLLLVPLSGTELGVCLFIIRKCYGYKKKQDHISLSQFQKALNKSRQSIVKALQSLQEYQIIQLLQRGNSKCNSNLYMFFKDYDQWKLVNKPLLVNNTELVMGSLLVKEAELVNEPLLDNPPTSQLNDVQLVNKPRHTKERTKEITTCDTQTVSRVFDAFCAAWEAQHGLKYSASFGKDQKLLQYLLKVYPEIKLIELIHEYIQSSDDFVIKCGKTIGGLKSFINKIVVQKVNNIVNI
jgi:phage replication O-like protein O